MMNRLLGAALLGSIALTGCEQSNPNANERTGRGLSTPESRRGDTTGTDSRPAPQGPGLQTPEVTRPDPAGATDSTVQNRRDREAHGVTPADQSDADMDVELTAAIRRAVVDDASLSMTAKNCKIVADKLGIVTLRGVVESKSEKDAVEARAKSVAGVKTVNNMLDVKPE